MKFKTLASGASLYEIPYFVDNRGALNVLEISRELPFGCERIFYTYSVKEGCVRGEHAHIKCEEFLVALRGKLNVAIDNGLHRDEIVLDSPSVGLHLPAGCWGEQFSHSPDCILLVLASRPYENEDYIREYDKFVAWKKQLKEEDRTHG